MLENSLNLLIREPSLDVIIASIISILSISFVIIKIFFKVLNKKPFEKMLTPKYEAVWEDFLEIIFTSLIFTFGLMSAGYSIGVRFNPLGNVWLILLLQLVWIIIIAVCFIIMAIISIPKFKSLIKQGYTSKKIIKCSLLLSYVGIFFTVLIIMSFYVSNALEEDVSLYNQLPVMFFFGITNVILFTISVATVRLINRALHLFNMQREIYKVSKIDSNQVNNLYFIYAMKEDIHILRETKDLNDNDLSVVFVYYVKEDILLKYQKQSIITTKKRVEAVK